MSKYIICSRCNVNLKIKNFEMNRNDEYFKQCNKCRNYCKEYQHKYKDQIKKYIETHKNIQTCKCGLTYNMQYPSRQKEHEKTYDHIFKVLVIIANTPISFGRYKGTKLITLPQSYLTSTRNRKTNNKKRLKFIDMLDEFNEKHKYISTYVHKCITWDKDDYWISMPDEKIKIMYETLTKFILLREEANKL